MASEGPNYGDESVPGMAELLRIRAAYVPDQAPDGYFNFGYIHRRPGLTAVAEKVEAPFAKDVEFNSE